MTKYPFRTCPTCKDYLGVVVRDPPESKKEVPIAFFRVIALMLWLVMGLSLVPDLIAKVIR